ncbi:MAG: ABC transporter permease subunit [Desulfobulbus sp.]|nr:ABC transporter permease subunit [Desulfobulbus sp.]
MMQVTWPLAIITLKEGLRQRILYGVLIVSLLLILFGVLISGLFMRDTLKILLDICLSAVSIGGLLVPFFLSINLLAGDIEKRTIYTLLSRNISRNQYIIGKFLGLALLTGIIMALLTAATLLAVLLASFIYPAHVFAHFSALPILISSCLAFLGIQVLNSAVFLWCSVTTSSFLATLLTMSTYIIGHSVEDVVRFISLEVKGVEIALTTELTARFALYAFPNLAAFDLKQQAAHSLPISLQETWILVVYGVAYSTLMLILAAFFLRRRDLP